MKFIRWRPSPGTVIATIALVFAVSGAAGALPGKNSVASNDIRKGAVKAKHLAKKAVKAKHVAKGAIRTRHLAADAVAPRVRALTETAQVATLTADDTQIVLSREVAPGSYAVMAKLTLTTLGDDSFEFRLMRDGTAIDFELVDPPATGVMDLGVSLLGIAVLSEPGELQVEARSGSASGQLARLKLIAVPIG
ncbi:MAG TPA: hypothetical protein VIL04_10125 [Solirubrobacterales bacterium]